MTAALLNLTKRSSEKLFLALEPRIIFEAFETALTKAALLLKSEVQLRRDITFIAERFTWVGQKYKREPRVPDAVLTLVSQYKPNNGASAKEFEAFQKGFRESERREQVIQWLSREQDYLRADELGESGRLAFLSRDLSSEK